MSGRVREGLIGVRPPRGIESYRSQSVHMSVALSSQQFGSTCPENSSTKKWVTLQPGVGHRRDRVRWNPQVEGNRMV